MYDVAINQKEYEKVIATFLQEVRTSYIFEDVAETIIQEINQKKEEKNYQNIQTGTELCEVLNSQLFEISKDKHLRISFSSEKQPIIKDPMNDPKWLKEHQQNSSNDNFGFYKLERLPGNVGYIDLRSFAFPQYGGETAMLALNFLSNTDALIFDLRKNIGGHPGMVALLISYFLNSDSVHPTHIGDIYWKNKGMTQQYWSYPYLPGRRYIDKPVYILTSSNTFSGAEQFAYEMKNMKRAIVIGETTMGGANPAPPTPLNEYFTAFIPSGQAISPITNENWEGKGVEPNIQALQEEAREVAYTNALQVIIETEESKGDKGKSIKEAKRILNERNGIV